MRDGDHPTRQELAYRRWKVVREDGTEVAVYAGRTPDDELLGKLLAMWSREVRMDEWSDRRRFAALCARESTLTVPEAAGMTGLESDEVREVPLSDGPPWELDNPHQTGRVRVIKETGRPDSMRGQ